MFPGPAGPVGPIGPPEGPTGPVGPIAPSSPFSPVWPIGPVGPLPTIALNGIESSGNCINPFTDKSPAINTFSLKEASSDTNNRPLIDKSSATIRLKLVVSVLIILA